jgi:F-type H+-transporting ATPase subunit b
MATTTDTVTGTPGHHYQTDLTNINTSMVVFTWVSFFLVLAILHKFAWKPILAGLDRREAAIRKSVEEAERIRREMERLHRTSLEMTRQAQAKARAIIEESRRAAREAARNIEEKAKEQSRIFVENARREITEAREKAWAELRAESAELAITLAGKILEENLDDQKNRRLVDEFIKTL